ncbi:Vacuolar-sorting receptor 1 [Hordeum vulgare]|nr:Vacuolar-sorting receptor 1 [Hordeum vulgare]
MAAAGDCGGAKEASRHTTGMQIPSGMEQERGFRLKCRMETTIIGNGGTKGAGTGFTFPFVVDKTSTFVQFRGSISDKYPWGIFDVVEFRYWDMQNIVWVRVQNEDELGVMFATNVESNLVQLEINVIQRKRGETERRVVRSAPNPSQPRSNQTSRRKAIASRRKAAASSSQSQSTVRQRGTPSANLPSQPCPEYSKATTDPIIEEEFPDEVPTDDEDERMHPKFVARKPPNEDDGEDCIPPPQFEDTDSHAREEDMDMGYSETEDEGRPDVFITDMIIL